jgi:hypothetical protein
MGGWFGLRATIAACGVVGIIMGVALFRLTTLPTMSELPRLDERDSSESASA